MSHALSTPCLDGLEKPNENDGNNKNEWGELKKQHTPTAATTTTAPPTAASAVAAAAAAIIQ